MSQHLEQGSDVGRRLERAQRQYENLLMHAGDVLLEQPGTPSAAPFDPFDSTPIRHGIMTGFDGTGVPASPNLHRSFYESQDGEGEGQGQGSDIPEKEKDTIILSLQEEVERLRGKLEGTICSVETVIQDAQTAQEDIETHYNSTIYDLSTRNSHLEEENYQLTVTLDLATAELVVERDSLLRAARFIERLKRRGREYTDAQRRSHSVLLATTTHHLGSPVAHTQRLMGMGIHIVGMGTVAPPRNTYQETETKT
eukprot:CAMPEP_0173203832 /NCGR_PEP_ID=MMETSP1141-20130122/19744_1 /TAXON_ID=483371 /ORGANISM="non described non described, Strain CCMP2298" /LENGTH=253 /DNA_ID=CAMNT_0014129345 /DNA_START=28 /DNA_END=790 /DNA_ORIENTATION=+